VEVRSINNASFIISLDEERARLLAEDNDIQLNRFVIMPVCADGPRFEKRSIYLKEKFNLPEGKIILLYAGFLSKWAFCEELAQSALHWDDNWVLILHSHGYHDPGYLKCLKKYVGKKVLLSLDPVPYEDLPALLSSADIGIALYKNIGKNFHLIDSASGKLAHYLQAGLPVIVNDFPGIRSVIERYNCGLSVKGIEGVPGAADRIMNNYIAMHNNAFRCYEDNYVFSKHFSRVMDRIEMI
jgi:glycosyltransferase involved in cell wall biosynthesis